MRVRRLSLTTVLIGLAWVATAQQLELPLKPGSLRFAVIGDSGTGGNAQYEIARRMIAARAKFPYELVIMMGDNMYGSESAGDFEKKFERPYKPLLDAGVKFYAALGNHDDPNQRFYKPFNMNGERYYSFKPSVPGIRFFALDSNYMDKAQLQWVDQELRNSGSDWKLCFFHHPIYSSGERHGSNLQLRDVLEPLFLKYGVDVVFTGHEHFYERLKPQKGINYFISGSSAKLRQGNIAPSELTAKGYDRGYEFMLVEIAADEMYYQTISEAGKTVDAGSIRRPPKNKLNLDPVASTKPPL